MRKKISLFVVDDEPAVLELLKHTLSPEKYDLEAYENPRAVLDRCESREFDVGIIDINMPGMNGLELIRALKSRALLTECIVLTGQSSVATAIESMKMGCYDYLLKPVKIDKLELVIGKAFEKKSISRENAILKEELQLKDSPREMIGDSEPMKAVFTLIDKVAPTSSLVLITGESGTGKELAAHAIHTNGKRTDKPFIIIDCIALPDHLLENELFGHEKGAFTDAGALKHGLFKLADGGTLFIDEIGELSLATQSKLLRVIETHRFRRLGGTREIEVDVRIIAATNRDLRKEVDNGGFRNDFFYRLNVVPIHMPPLRERTQDIPLLVKHFIEKDRANVQKKKMSREAMESLMRYPWPGNVRELSNVIERALIISTGNRIMPVDVPLSVPGRTATPPPGSRPLKDLVKEYEKEVIERALKENNGHKTAAARTLGLSRAQFYRKLGELKIGQ